MPGWLSERACDSFDLRVEFKPHIRHGAYLETNKQEGQEWVQL